MAPDAGKMQGKRLRLFVEIILLIAGVRATEPYVLYYVKICVTRGPGRTVISRFSELMSISGLLEFFEKSRNHLKILGDRKVTWSKIQNGDPLTLDATVRNLVTMATWWAGFIHL